MLLEQIHEPADLKKLSYRQLRQLADELRAEIMKVVSDRGGHLASNLGVVELTLAIHYVFDAPEDKLVLDVGHQSYAHKLLTGRYEAFQRLRQQGGASGFPQMEESEYDAFTAGHASTAISAARSFGNMNTPVEIQQKAMLLSPFSSARSRQDL